MNKKEVSEIKEEIFKYFEIFRKALSGTIGKNLINMEFPLHTEEKGGTQEFLMRLRASRLTDPELLEQFYDKIIASYDYGENYLILLIHAAYDIPGKALDGEEMFDASDETYEYLLCCICPVNLSKPGLAYNTVENCFQNRIRDWVVDMPDLGFLFPAFTDRSTDIHSLLYYTKKPEDLHDVFVEQILGSALPLTAGNQKTGFQSLVENSLGDVKTIHEKLTELAQVKKDDPEPPSLDKNEIKSLLVQSGADREKLEDFEMQYESCTGSDLPLLVSNVASTKKFEIKTPDVVITVNPERTDLVETQVIDGRKYLMIPVDDRVELNGISVKMI